MNTQVNIEHPLLPIEINIASRPAQIVANLEQLREQLAQELARYDVVVTLDTLKDAKKLAADLNKRASELDSRRKTVVAQVSAPVKEFEGEIKQLVQLCKDGRQKIVDQVRRFEDVTKAQILAQVIRLREQAWIEADVEPDYRRAQVDDLAKLTAANANGHLTKATRQDIESRVAADKALQDKAITRLLQLEVYSYRAGLTIPLTREHVQGFLLEASDEIYRAQLERVIASEADRNSRTLAVEKARWEREQAQAAKAAPAPAPAVDAPAAERARHYRFGVLRDGQAAALELEFDGFDDAAQQARDNSAGNNVPFGIWGDSGLMAIAYDGEIFRK